MRIDRITRIARWEATRSVGSIDRRTAIALLVVFLALGALVPTILAVGTTPGSGMYRVGISEQSSYYTVVQETPELRPVPPDRTEFNSGSLEVLVSGTNVYAAPSEKGRAAARVLRESIVSYNDQLMRAEANQAAAFPVSVTLRYESQVPIEQYTGQTSPAQSGEVAGGTIESPDGDVEGASTGSDDGQPPTDGGSDSDTGADSDTDEQAQSSGDAIQTGGDSAGGPIPGAPAGGIFGTTQSGTPSSIAPPFPLRSLLLAFLFLLPLNLIIQAYGSSVLAERINRRGEPLLVSPATRGDIVLGKAIPYFALAVAITTVIAVGVGGGWLSIAAVTPIAALFLASTFVAGMLARSYKELTFVTVTISVVLTGYAFIPAVLTDVHPIAAISPLTVVVQDIRANPVGWGQFVFATLPVTLAAVVLYRLGTGMYREEDMFTQRPLPQKVLDALSAPLDTPWHVGLWTVLFVPFVLVAELFAVSILYVLPGSVSIPLMLGAVALLEEVAKSIHVFAGFERARFSRSIRSGAILGAISGIGFFVGEKLLLITQLVGLPELAVGRVAFAPAVLGISPVILLFAPLVLHTVTAAIGSIGASRSKRAYLGALLVAVVIHLGYNLQVVSTLA